MQKIKNLLQNNLKREPAVWFAWLAAILYSSWPLGFILNPAVGRHDLASELEAPHQPYSWVFISMDILTGIIILLVGLLQLKKRKPGMLIAASISYVLFGAFVGVAALSPLSCDPAIQKCGPLLRDPKLVVHGGSSIISVLFLLVSVALVAKVIYESTQTHLLRLLIKALLVSWAIFGVGSLLEIWFRIHNNLLQYFFISVCSLSIVMVVTVIEKLTPKDSSLKVLTRTAKRPAPNLN